MNIWGIDMGISLERAIEIVCSVGNSLVVSEEDFYKHLDNYGVNLTVEFYQNKDSEVSTIFYRDIRDNDVVGFSTGSEVLEYRTVNILPNTIF
jgi:hypothetical protein